MCRPFQSHRLTEYTGQHGIALPPPLPGRNSLGVECPSPHPMGRGTQGEVSVNFKLAASRLLNENSSLFGQTRFQIELKPHAAVEAVTTVEERAPPYGTGAQEGP